VQLIHVDRQTQLS